MTCHLLIDTDPGIDDALAILLALASPEAHIEAVTVVAGNVPVDLATANARRILAVAAPSPMPPVIAMRIECGIPLTIISRTLKSVTARNRHPDMNTAPSAGKRIRYASRSCRLRRRRPDLTGSVPVGAGSSATRRLTSSNVGRVA